MQHQSDSRIGGKGRDVGIPIPFCRLQFIFLDNLPPVENQGVDDVGKYVVEGLQLFLCNTCIWITISVIM